MDNFKKLIKEALTPDFLKESVVEASKGDEELKKLKDQAKKFDKKDIRYKEIQKKIYDLETDKSYGLSGSKAAKKFDIKEYLKKGKLYKTKLILKEWVGGELEKRNEPLYDELVPGQGASDYVEGEMIRAINRIIYRFYNDGDRFWEDYGTETAGPAHAYLVNSDRIPQEIRSKLESIFDGTVQKWDDKVYEAAIRKAMDVVISYVESKEGNYAEHNEDLFDYDAEYDYEEDEEDEYDYYDEDDDEDEY